MPRKGYEVITVTKEARDALMELKVKLNAKSISEAIVKLNTLVDAFYAVISPDYESRGGLEEGDRKVTPIRIHIRQR